MSKISLFLFLVITTILISSPFADSVFAEKNDVKNKNDNKPFQALLDMITALQEKLDQLLFQVNTHEEKINALEQNSINCENEYMLKGQFHDPPYRDYQLSPICESQVQPLHVELGSDMTAHAVYTTTIYPDEEVPDSEPLVIYEASCSITPDGDISGSFIRVIRANVISSSHTGFLDFANYDNAGISTGIQNSIQHNIGLGAFVLIRDLSTLPSPIPTAEEAIGEFTATIQVTAFDSFGDYLEEGKSDTATYSCTP